MTVLNLISSLSNASCGKNAAIEDCILEMKTGSRDALSEFYSLCKSSIYGFALSILKNKDDAEDVLQDVILKIYRSADLYKKKGNPMPWILQITKNYSLMKIRENSRLSYKTEDEWENLMFTEDSLAQEDRFILHDLLSYISDEERQIVILHAVTGLKHREIAELLGINLSTCLSKYRRAIEKLQGKYERSQNNEGR